MRDIERINETLDWLEEYWRENRDLRLGQILSDAAASTGNHWHCTECRRGNPGSIPDPFYMEDGELVEYLKRQTGDSR